jgi:hypothetical protein
LVFVHDYQCILVLPDGPFKDFLKNLGDERLYKCEFSGCISGVRLGREVRTYWIPLIRITAPEGAPLLQRSVSLLLQRQASLLQRQVSLLQVEGEAGHELTLHNIPHSLRQLGEFCLPFDELPSESMSLYRCQWQRRMNNSAVVKKSTLGQCHSSLPFQNQYEFLINPTLAFIGCWRPDSL